MKCLIFFIIIFLNISLFGQTIDLHTHITNKHFMNDVSDPDSVRIYLKRDNKLPDNYLKNWEGHYPNNWDIAKTSDAIHKDDSHYGNYFQSTYSDLQKGEIKIAIQAISPLEINIFHDPSKLFRSIVTRTGVAKSGIPYKNYMTLIHTPSWREAYNEYLYTVHQNTYNQEGNYKMIFPENSDSLYKHINDPNTSIGIISFEGGHILFGDKVYEEEGFMNSALSDEAKKEVRKNIDTIRNFIQHRVFFVTPVHIYWNTLGGQAKAIDKYGQTTTLDRASTLLWFRKKIFTKYGSGLPPKQNLNYTGHPDTNCNCPDNTIRVDNSCYAEAPPTDNFGKEVIDSLLSKNNKWHKRIYIDVKHMDVRSRLDYYLLHDSLVKATGDTIPIIYSHGAVSGKKLKVAYYTSVSPLMDDYGEIINPKSFYEDLFYNYTHRNCGLIKDYGDKEEDREWFKEKGMDDPEISLEDIKLTNSKDDQATVGWFYPWSINLFDEEIPEIYNSDGIIGVMADERTLGWYLPNYQDADSITNLKSELIKLGFFSSNVSKIDLDSFRVAELFLRNIFYIVKHSGRKDTTAWDHIGFGSDFDGFINPIDICQTSADVPKFQEYLIRIIPYFLKIHEEYQVPGNDQGLLFGLSPKDAMRKLFYENAKRLIMKYF